MPVNTNAPDREGTITVPVRLDSGTFRRFAFYDAFVEKRRWRGPALFSAILLAFAAVALLSGKDQSGLMAAVLLAVGLGLPMIYLGSFLGQVNRQAKANRLTPPRLVYTVTLDASGVSVEGHTRREEELRLEWPSLYRACRRKGCIYLYAAPNRAFLLPSGQAGVADDELWAFLAAHMDRDKLRGGAQSRRAEK